MTDTTIRHDHDQYERFLGFIQEAIDKMSAELYREFSSGHLVLANLTSLKVGLELSIFATAFDYSPEYMKTKSMGDHTLVSD